MRTANPALRSDTFARGQARGEEAMTAQGAASKTALLLVLVVAAAGWSWERIHNEGQAAVGGLVMAGLIGGLIAAIATILKPRWAAWTGPAYAVLEGLLIGALSSLFEARYPGIVIQAVSLTFGTAGAMLLAYKLRIVTVTHRFRMGVVAATGGIALVYLATLVLGFFGISVPFIHGSGTIGILFSLFVVVVAALNLVLDFDMIESAAEAGAPKYMEWYGAFALTVTLVWLYLEILRLLSKLRSRR